MMKSKMFIDLQHIPLLSQHDIDKRKIGDMSRKSYNNDPQTEEHEDSEENEETLQYDEYYTTAQQISMSLSMLRNKEIKQAMFAVFKEILRLLHVLFLFYITLHSIGFVIWFWNKTSILDRLDPMCIFMVPYLYQISKRNTSCLLDKLILLYFSIVIINLSFSFSRKKFNSYDHDTWIYQSIHLVANIFRVSINTMKNNIHNFLNNILPTEGEWMSIYLKDPLSLSNLTVFENAMQAAKKCNLRNRLSSALCVSDFINFLADTMSNTLRFITTIIFVCFNSLFKMCVTTTIVNSNATQILIKT